MAVNFPDSSADLQADGHSELADHPAPAPAPEYLEEQTMADLGIPPMIVQSRAAFLRDLPRLLEVRAGEWVAYHGDQHLGLAKTRAELFQACLRRGLRREEFLVCSIEPQMETMTVRPELLD